jgi:hypothetical protein
VHNTGLEKVAVQCSADTFVVNQSLVLRRHICGENRHLRQARKRSVFLSLLFYFNCLVSRLSLKIRAKGGAMRLVSFPWKILFLNLFFLRN